jgi:hypothetical protein
MRRGGGCREGEDAESEGQAGLEVDVQAAYAGQLLLGYIQVVQHFAFMCAKKGEGGWGVRVRKRLEAKPP